MIKTGAELSKEALQELNKFQKGDRKLLKTGRKYIDSHLGGILPRSGVLIGAKSGNGKTVEYQRVMKGILENQQDVVILNFMLEMSFLDMTIRDIHVLTKKKKSKIISETLTDEEKEIVRQYHEGMKDGRQFYVQEDVTADEFYNITREFCLQNKDKQYCVVGLDHLILVGGDNALSKMARYTNKLRKEFPNFYFIYLSQLNRSDYGTTAERSNSMVPTTSLVYGSSEMEFLVSLVVIISNPFKQGVLEYMKFKPERYEEYSKFYSDVDTKGFVSFNTIGNMFYHVCKIRESDNIYDNLYVEQMELNEQEFLKMKQEAEKEKPSIPSSFDMPVFTPTSSAITKTSWGKSESGDNVPF